MKCFSERISVKNFNWKIPYKQNNNIRTRAFAIVYFIGMLSRHLTLQLLLVLMYFFLLFFSLPPFNLAQFLELEMYSHPAGSQVLVT